MTYSQKSLIAIPILLVLILSTYYFGQPYWQSLNTQYLIDNNQSSRVFPHRINSISKLDEIWIDGFRSFEIDIFFRTGSSSYFQVGHDASSLGSTLSDTLDSVDHSEIQRIWLDVKNLNKNNITQALEKLNELNKKYNFKDKVIFESGNKSPLLKIFREDNWHTSYYLPTELILKSLKDNDTATLDSISHTIKKQIILQDVSAISFDSRLYPFVKNHLEKIIPEAIVYHTWWGPKIYKLEFRVKLQQNELFLNDRVKTILIKYKNKDKH